MNEYRQSHFGVLHTLPGRKTFPVHLPELLSDDSFFLAQIGGFLVGDVFLAPSALLLIEMQIGEHTSS